MLVKNKEGADYKAATKLRDEINTKVSDASKNQASQTPAAKPDSALADPNQPDVNVDTNNAPSVTPAPSIKPNPATNLPQLSPAPSQGAQQQRAQ